MVVNSSTCTVQSYIESFQLLHVCVSLPLVHKYPLKVTKSRSTGLQLYCTCTCQHVIANVEVNYQMFMFVIVYSVHCVLARCHKFPVPHVQYIVQ